MGNSNDSHRRSDGAPYGQPQYSAQAGQYRAPPPNAVAYPAPYPVAVPYARAPAPHGAYYGAYPNQQQQQLMQSLVMAGVQPDWAFNPYQMPRMRNPMPAPVPQQQQQAIKLKNDVNVKKNSLALLHNHGHVYGLSFEFDALVPCTIRVYFFATEVVDQRNRTVRLDQNVYAQQQKSYDFPAGTNQHFKLPEADWIDLGKFSPAQLFYSPHTLFFPIVITIDGTAVSSQASAAPSAPPLSDAVSSGTSASKAVSENGGASGSASDSAGSASAPSAETHIKHQATFATFSRRVGGGLDVKVIKQKIEVDGVSYELQEIYGLEKSPDNDTSSDCVVCLTNPRTYTLLPCRHLCLCGECSVTLMNTSPKCPVCRAHVDSTLQINVVDKTKDDSSGAGPAAAGSQ